MDQMNYQGTSSRTGELYGEPTVYHACTPLSIFNRYEDTIGPWCMKFLSVKETADDGTGTDLEIMYQRYKTINSHRYPTLGNFHDYHGCLEYLENKAKFTKWHTSMEEDANKKKTTAKHPTRKNAAQQAIADEKLVKDVIAKAKSKVLSRSDEFMTSGRDAIYNKLGTVVENVAVAFLSCMEEENEAKLIESLDSPLKCEWAKKKIKKKLLESHLKHCKLEQELQENHVINVKAMDNILFA